MKDELENKEGIPEWAQQIIDSLQTLSERMTSQPEGTPPQPEERIVEVPIPPAPPQPENPPEEPQPEEPEPQPESRLKKFKNWLF